MGQSTPNRSSAFDRREAFRQTVLQGAERLSRQDIRQLADDLHDLARGKASVAGRPPRKTSLEDDGVSVWI